MAVTYRARKRAVPYRTRLTGRLMCDEGFDANASDPSPFWPGDSPINGVIPGLAKREPGIIEPPGMWRNGFRVRAAHAPE